MASTVTGCLAEKSSADVIIQIAKPVLRQKKLFLVTKRVFDIVCSFLGLLILAIPMMIIALIITIDSPGAPIFKQERLGINGKPFMIYKFRSMRLDAEENGPQWADEQDPRCTHFGQILRRTRLDELPQLYNILRGDMSFVGPRPELLRYTEVYQGEEKQILEVRPGITDFSSIEFISLDEIVGTENADEMYEKYVLQRKNRLRIRYAQEAIDGSCTILLLTPDAIIAARDRLGRLPVLVGKNNDGLCVSFESFAYHKLGYQDHYELGPGEIVKMTADGLTQLAAPGTKMKICAFLWTYYGYPNSNYEGKNVEVMRYRNGEIMARKEMEAGTMPDVDFVAGVPDSGLPHAIGYANQSHKPFARPFVKYTPTWPRSFTPANQEMRNLVAKMKQIPVPELIQGKKLLFVDDSIVRGTQLRETVDFLYESGAKEVHMRSACPPIMYGCKYLNFSRSNSEMELIARRTVQNLEGDEGQKHLDEYADGSTQRGKCMLKAICEEMGFDSLGYQSLDGLLEAIGLDKDKVCTYCWNGKE